MTSNASGLQHQNIRKRIYSKYEKYPHPDKFKRFYDKLIYVAVIFGPIMVLPQLIKILVTKSAEGVSAISLLGLSIISTLWFIYGIIHKEKPIMITNIFFMLFQIMIVIATWVY